MTSLFDNPVEVVKAPETDLPPLKALFEPAPFPKVEGVQVCDKAPRLDTDLLSDIVYWAYLDAMYGKDLPGDAKVRYADWGRWEQASWTESLLDDGDLATRLFRGADGHHREHVGLTRQELHVCSSAFCIAGQVVSQRGMVMLVNDDSLAADSCAPRGVRVKNAQSGTWEWTYDEDQIESIEAAAKQFLGLLPVEATKLFDADNEIETVVSWACYFARRRGQELLLPPEVLEMDRQYRDGRLASFHVAEDGRIRDCQCQGDFRDHWDEADRRERESVEIRVSEGVDDIGYLVSSVTGDPVNGYTVTLVPGE